MATPNLMTGAHILVYVNGKLLGRCAGFSWQSNANRKKIKTIDILHPVELAIAGTEISWSMRVFRSLGDGGSQGAQMMAPQDVVSREQYFTLLLIDRKFKTTVFKADYCQADSESWTIEPKALVSGNISGSAVVWTNEAAPSRL